jgi:hypothetical protein
VIKVKSIFLDVEGWLVRLKGFNEKEFLKRISKRMMELEMRDWKVVYKYCV